MDSTSLKKATNAMKICFKINQIWEKKKIRLLKRQNILDRKSMEKKKKVGLLFTEIEYVFNLKLFKSCDFLAEHRCLTLLNKW